MEGQTDWQNRFAFDWRTPEGHARLLELTQSSLPFTPAEFQVVQTARLLMGQDVMLISATGDGKTALIYMYAMVRPDTISVVVSPTNALESDMVANFERLGVRAVAINSESLAKAELEEPGRDIWREINEKKHQVIFVSPELLGDDRFRAFLQNKDVRPWLALLVVDEVHLVDEWGKDFREAYRRIRNARPWFPEWTTALALTATLEPGEQTKRVVDAVGLRNDFHLEQRDCARYNVDIVFRRIEHAYTTTEFRDLDWLVPAGIRTPSDVEKTLIYRETIELGHRVANYLRSLLPGPLRANKYTVVRHLHSMNCPQCKEDGLASLYQTGDRRETGIHVTTDVLGTGMNMADFDRIICFVTPSSAAALVQRIGRTSRGRGRHGVAYIYLKKTDVEAVENWLQKTNDTELDSRLLRTPAARSPALQEDSQSTTTPKSGRGPAASSRKPKDTSHLCPSLRLIIAAHVQGACISRQINIIYQNPQTGIDCGRCSSCLPRPLPSSQPPPSPPVHAPMPPTTTHNATDDQPKVPAWQKLTTKDATEFTERLQDAALRIRHTASSLPADFLYIGYKSFLSSSYIRRILADFHLVTSRQVLQERMSGWPYWEQFGDALWDEVRALQEEARVRLESRHEAKLEKQRESSDVRARPQAAKPAKPSREKPGQAEPLCTWWEGFCGPTARLCIQAVGPGP